MEYSLAGFNGQRPDPLTEHYLLGNGYRAYSPVLERFTAPDSWSPFGSGGINPYAYCAGDPVNRTDPSGHFSLGQEIGMALGFVAGIALSILTEGAAMPAVVSLVATMAGDAAIGAGAELATEAIDRERINWGQVGMAAGLSAATSLIGFGGIRGRSIAGRAAYRSLGKVSTRTAIPAEKYYSTMWGLAEFTPLSAPEIGHSPATLNAAFAFVDEASPGSRRLNICGHGSATKYGMLFYRPNGETYRASAKDIIDELNHQGMSMENIDSLRLVSCHGADNGLAQEFADITYLPVEGFHGIVFFDFPGHFYEHIVNAINIHKNEALRMIDNGQTIDWIRTSSFYHFQPREGYFMFEGKITTNYPEWFSPQQW